ncbi:hypothetical protein ACTL32_01245 [Planococcus sp. FY231025]|uniref:hypothetical protein n=1 Tax=Planococcus sp. FY231025 TaxID=3455699 RepID=UPI003F902FBF
MWAIILSSITIFLTIIFSLAKASSRGEEMSKRHREELQERAIKNQDTEEFSDSNKTDVKKVN